jgi:hypothetical protein
VELVLVLVSVLVLAPAIVPNFRKPKFDEIKERNGTEVKANEGTKVLAVAHYARDQPQRYSLSSDECIELNTTDKDNLRWSRRLSGIEMSSVGMSDVKRSWFSEQTTQ